MQLQFRYMKHEMFQSSTCYNALYSSLFMLDIKLLIKIYIFNFHEMTGFELQFIQAHRICLHFETLLIHVIQNHRFRVNSLKFILITFYYFIYLQCLQSLSQSRYCRHTLFILYVYIFAIQLNEKSNFYCISYSLVLLRLSIV